MTCGCTFFNKALYEDVFGDPDELYKLTLDGGRTLDKFREMAGAAIILAATVLGQRD